jgi:hypothetical protein
MSTAIALLVLAASVPLLVLFIALRAERRESARLLAALRAAQARGAPCVMALVMIRDGSPSLLEAALIARAALDVAGVPRGAGGSDERKDCRKTHTGSDQGRSTL